MNKKYQFSAISIKIEVAQRFRKFSKKVSSSHTQTLIAILDFFEIHQLSPLDSIDGSLSAVEIRIKRRISNAIAII
ncbi:MAG: BfmA/BtgA family mobilization protein, partial [Algibacter sp.]